MKILAMLLIALAGVASPPKPRTADALTVELKGDAYTGRLTEGFHFNEKAPNVIVVDGKSIKPAKLEPRLIMFTGLPKSFSAGKAHLYVCDDAVTFCEPRVFELGTGAGEVQLKEKSPAKPGKVNKHGFIEEDFQGAIAKAKPKNQLILVDFSARWCPGCMRLESEIFQTKEFKSLTRDLVKVKIDVDRFENTVLAERFKIQGIPTLLVLNSAQEEIDRIYDYQPMSTLGLFINSIKADPTSLMELEKKAEGKDKNAVHLLGKRLVMAGRFEDALRHLSAVTPRPPEYWTARIGAAAKDELAAVLREAISAEPGSSRSIGWRTELIGLSDSKLETESLMKTGVALADQLLKDAHARTDAMKTDLIGEFTGYEPLMIALAKVDLLVAGKVTAERQTAAWAEAAAIGKKLRISAAAPGPAIRYLGTLIKAERLQEADRLSNELLKRDPANAEIQNRRLRVLLAMKRYPEAIKLGEISLKNSYGRNEFWVAENLAKAYIGAKRNDEARKLLDGYLSRKDAEWPNIQGSRKSMEELRKTTL